MSTLADNAITYVKLLSTVFSGQVNTYTNTGHGGGTGYYVNLGGIKLCWGITGAAATANPDTRNISFPSGFFTNVRSVSVELSSNTTVSSQLASPPSTSSMGVYMYGASTSATTYYWFAIGS